MSKMPTALPYGIQTEEYEFAKSVTCAKVIIEIDDERTFQTVRARCEIDGVEHGIVTRISPWSELTIGQAVDMSLQELSPVFSQPEDLGVDYKVLTKRTLLEVYRSLFGLRRLFIVDYWRIKLLFPKGYRGCLDTPQRNPSPPFSPS